MTCCGHLLHIHLTLYLNTLIFIRSSSCLLPTSLFYYNLLGPFKHCQVPTKINFFILQMKLLLLPSKFSYLKAYCLIFSNLLSFSFRADSLSHSLVETIWPYFISIVFIFAWSVRFFIRFRTILIALPRFFDRVTIGSLLTLAVSYFSFFCRLKLLFAVCFCSSSLLYWLSSVRQLY